MLLDNENDQILPVTERVVIVTKLHASEEENPILSYEANAFFRRMYFFFAGVSRGIT